jgi:hypothetical protein
MAKVAMLGAGFIGDFYSHSLHGLRSRDRVHIIYSRYEVAETDGRKKIILKEKKTGKIIQKEK